MPRIERDRELARRRKRREKMLKLTQKYLKATSPADKEAIVAKVRRISPMLDFEGRMKAQQS